MIQSEAIDELSKALAVAQGAMKSAAFNRINPHFKNRYADLAAILDAVREPLSRNGLAVTQVMTSYESGLYLCTTLHHASGQWLRSMYPLPAMGRPQEFGSALTYARRYSLSAIAGIAADEDDDANAANAKPKAAPAKKPTLEEEMNDSIPDFGASAPPKQEAAGAPTSPSAPAATPLDKEWLLTVAKQQALDGDKKRFHAWAKTQTEPARKILREHYDELFPK